MRTSEMPKDWKNESSRQGPGRSPVSSIIRARIRWPILSVPAARSLPYPLLISRRPAQKSKRYPCSVSSQLRPAMRVPWKGAEDPSSC